MGYQRLEQGVSTQAITVTPSDTTNFASPIRALYVGAGGDLAIVPSGDDSPVILRSAVTGSFLPISIKRVDSTNTTATDLVGFL